MQAPPASRTTGTRFHRRRIGSRLAAADEANLALDHRGQVNVFLAAALLQPGGFVAEDGSADVDALRSALHDRLEPLDVLRRAVATAGSRHRWVHAEPDLEHHIRMAAPAEGLAGLERRCAELMGEPLPPGRPLWEILLVPDATSARVAMVVRVHHVVADGMAAVMLLRRLLDQDAPAEAGTTVQRGSDGRVPTAGPSARRRALAGLLRLWVTVRGGAVGPTVLLGPRGDDRGVAFVSVGLSTLESAARVRGATVNDALLAGVAAGLRAALAAVGEVPPTELPVSVPVALRRRGTAGNQVGVMLVSLPLLQDDADERLRTIAARTRVEKVRAREQGTFELMRGPIGARIMDALARRQRLAAAFVTNVPGPPHPLRLAGAPITGIWPVAVLAGNVRLGVAAVSYGGLLCCGVHFDAKAVPGATFAEAMRDELARLAG